MATTIRYPEGLPGPLLDTKSAQKVDGVRRTEYEDGYSFPRLVFDSTPTNFNVSFSFTTIQAQLFVNWHKYAINGGQRRFLMPIAMVDGVRLRDTAFTRMYSGPDRYGPDRWRVTAAIQIMDEETDSMNPDDWMFPDEILYSSLFDVNMNHDWPEA